MGVLRNWWQGFELRNWQEGDEESLAKNANNLAIWNQVRDYFPSPYTLQDAHDWVRIRKEDETSWAIVVDKQAVGGISVYLQEDVYKKNAELGYWLGEAYWGRGIMSKAVAETVKHCFAEFDIHRIYANVFESNVASMRVLEKCGFTKEAVLQESIYKNGRYQNEHIYAILNK